MYIESYSYFPPGISLARHKQKLVCDLLARAGINVNGANPWDVQVHDSRFYSSVLSHGSLGLGESYMARCWDSKALDVTLYKLLSANLDTQVGNNWWLMLYRLAGFILNGQSLAKAPGNISRHYDLDNELFASMLDTRMIYSCAYWQDAQTLDAAQEKKLDLICRKLQMESGQRLLDIGCGWGGLAGYAAEKYGVEVVGITLSQQQARSTGAQALRSLAG